MEHFENAFIFGKCLVLFLWIKKIFFFLISTIWPILIDLNIYRHERIKIATHAYNSVVSLDGLVNASERIRYSMPIDT